MVYSFSEILHSNENKQTSTTATTWMNHFTNIILTKRNQREKNANYKIIFT